MRTNTKLLFVAAICLGQLISCKKDNSSFTTSLNAESVDNAASDSTLSKGLVAWYTFNGDIFDHSGNNNNVIFNSAKPAKGKSGLLKTAYVFDGASYMQIADAASINPQKISIYALIKPTGFYQGICHANRIISKGYNDWDNGRYILGFDDQPYYNWDGCHQPVQTKFENFHSGFGDGSSASGNTDTYNYVKTNQWYSLVYTYDGTYSKLYINGVLVNKIAKSTTFNGNGNPLYIGRNEDPTYPYYFKGIIDEIRIYKRALTAGEVLKLYNRN